MAELPHIGKHCHVAECCQLDFLPFRCDHCKNIFCLDHSTTSSHRCKEFAELFDERSKSTSITSPTKYPCFLAECKNAELIPVTCEHCHENVCLHHRHQKDHNCRNLVEPEEQMVKTKALVKEIVSSQASQSKPACRGRKSAKTNAQVQLMKLKLHALGENTLPVDERIYLLIHLPHNHKQKDQAYFFSKYWTVGKAIDYTASKENLKNNNNISTADKLCLFSADDGKAFDMATPLSHLCEQGLLVSGGNAVLEYIAPGQTQLENIQNYK